MNYIINGKTNNYRVNIEDYCTLTENKIIESDKSIIYSENILSNVKSININFIYVNLKYNKIIKITTKINNINEYIIITPDDLIIPWTSRKYENVELTIKRDHIYDTKIEITTESTQISEIIVNDVSYDIKGTTTIIFNLWENKFVKIYFKFDNNQFNCIEKEKELNNDDELKIIKNEIKSLNIELLNKTLDTNYKQIKNNRLISLTNNYNTLIENKYNLSYVVGVSQIEDSTEILFEQTILPPFLSSFYILIVDENGTELLIDSFMLYFKLVF